MEKETLDDKMMVDCGNMAVDSTVEGRMHINQVWVQCENESCLKWRLLSSEDASRVDHSEPWYCFMNTDLRYNRCSVSEEDFPEEYEFHRSGLKFVYSQLPLGSLVVVKLRSWPSWPGILCLDPFKGKYVACDLDGDVERYHIEFLGEPHSRSWINATFVGHYSTTLNSGKCQSKKKWYVSALQEAQLLYGYSPEQRLEKCYLSRQEKPQADTKVAVVAKKRMQDSKMNIEKEKPKFRKRKRRATFKCSFENVCSDDALSKENMVISETEQVLHELEHMLQQAVETPGTPDRCEEERAEDASPGKELPKCSPEASASSSFENYYEEDYLEIDGVKLKAGECIANITDKFKEIDALMSEF
ncbi:zinc finger CW-type PWWP domain protein 2 [Rhynchocyon petersi]